MTQAKIDLVVVPSFVAVVNEYYQDHMRSDAEEEYKSEQLQLTIDDIVEKLTEFERDHKGIQYPKIVRTKLGKEIKSFFPGVVVEEPRINGKKKTVYTFNKKCIESGLMKYPSIKIDNDFDTDDME